MKTFEGKVAIVTGGASGIGRELCRQVARQGAHVYVTDIDETGARAVAAEIGGSSARVDVADPAAVQSMVDRAVDERGRLDYIFNNAGFALGADVIDMELEHWYRILDVNLRGVIHGVHAAYPVMVRQGSGHIVNIASVAGLIAVPTQVAYATTKHAVVGLSRGLRREARAHGVKVSVVCPGFVDTEIFEHATYVKYDSAEAKRAISVKMMAPDKAVRQILRGVDANRETIVVTTHGQLLDRLQRYTPGLLDLLVRRLTKDVAAAKLDR